MSLNRYKQNGQSAIELSLLGGLVVLVSWAGLELVNSDFKQGLASYSEQYSGKPIVVLGSAAGLGSGSTTPSIPANGSNSAPPPGVGKSFPTAAVTSMPTSPIQTTGSNAYLVSSTPNTATQTQTNPTNPGIVTSTGTTVIPVANVASDTSASTTSFKPANTFATVNGGSTFGIGRKAINTVPISDGNAQPAAGDGCMGCAASMTTDLGW